MRSHYLFFNDYMAVSPFIPFLWSTLALFSLFVTTLSNVDDPTQEEFFDFVMLPPFWIITSLYLLYSAWWMVFPVAISPFLTAFLAKKVKMENSEAVASISSTLALCGMGFSILVRMCPVL